MQLSLEHNSKYGLVYTEYFIGHFGVTVQSPSQSHDWYKSASPLNQ